MIDPYDNRDDATAPIIRATQISLASDTTLPLASRGLWVGTGGTVIGALVGDPLTNVTFTNVPDGALLPFRFVTIRSTSNGTTASNLVACF